MNEQTNKYDLFIVGNGFDLSCGYKTKYEDFLRFGPSNNSKLFTCFNNTDGMGCFSNQDWNGFEKTLCQYLNFINYLFSSNSVKREFTSESYNGYNEYTFAIDRTIEKDVDLLLSLKSISISLRNIFTIKGSDGRVIRDYYVFLDALEQENFFPIKLVYRNFFKKSEAKKEVVEKRIIKSVNDELNKLELGLKCYIEKETSITNKPSSYIQKIIKDNNFDRILSFNYSHCAEKILNINHNKVFYVHGDINSSIVLGIEKNMIVNQTVDINSDYCIFFKRYRRILKDTINGFNETILNELSTNSRIGIFGHSLDLSDKSILEKILKKNCLKYDIYCYDDIDEYKKKLNLLIGIDLLEDLYAANKIEFIKINDNYELII